MPAEGGGAEKRNGGHGRVAAFVQRSVLCVHVTSFIYFFIASVRRASPSSIPGLYLELASLCVALSHGARASRRASPGRRCSLSPLLSRPLSVGGNAPGGRGSMKRSTRLRRVLRFDRGSRTLFAGALVTLKRCVRQCAAAFCDLLSVLLGDDDVTDVWCCLCSCVCSPEACVTGGYTIRERTFFVKPI